MLGNKGVIPRNRHEKHDAATGQVNLNFDQVQSLTFAPDWQDLDLVCGLAFDTSYESRYLINFLLRSIDPQVHRRVLLFDYDLRNKYGRDKQLVKVIRGHLPGVHFAHPDVAHCGTLNTFPETKRCLQITGSLVKLGILVGTDSPAP